MKKRDRNKKIRLQIEEYKEKIRKMNKAQFVAEWNRVMLCLNPDSSIKERIGDDGE